MSELAALAFNVSGVMGLSVPSRGGRGTRFLMRTPVLVELEGVRFVFRSDSEYTWQTQNT